MSERDDHAASQARSVRPPAPLPPPNATRRAAGRSPRVVAFGLVAVGLLAGSVGWTLRRAPVTVTPVVHGKAIDAVYATGTVEAEETVLVKARTAGTVATLLVREGAEVKQGDLLARIENPAIAFDLKRGQADRGAAFAMAGADSPQIGALKAQGQAIAVDLQTAQQELDRMDRLFASSAVASADVDRARSRTLQLQAALAANEAQQRAARIDLSANAAQKDAQLQSFASRLADTEIRSPMDGVVLSRTATVGDVVSVNQPLFKIGDTRSLVLELSVDEADVARISDGRQGAPPPSIVAVGLYAFPKQTFRGQVFEIMPDANRQRKAFLTKVRLASPPPGLRSGMSAEVNIIASQKDGALLIPTAAESDGFVWVAEDGHARRRAVTTNVRDLLRVEITGGLGEGEQVIVSGPANLTEGARVKTTVKEPDKLQPMPDLSQPIQTAVK